MDLTLGAHLVGRAEEADLRLSEPSVSRRHAEIIYENGRATVRDLGSHNGTRVNSASVERPTLLAPGDTLEVANCFFRVEGAETADATAGSPTRIPDDFDTTRFSKSAVVPNEEISWEEIRTERHAKKRDRQSRLFQVLAEAGDLLRRGRDGPLPEIFENLQEELSAFRGDAPVGDDVTLVLLRRGEDGWRRSSGDDSPRKTTTAPGTRDGRRFFCRSEPVRPAIAV